MVSFYYKPDEDTFLLIDTTHDLLKDKKITILGEIGCGSGEVIITLSEKKQAVLVLATDLNIEACRVTKERSKQESKEDIQVIAGNLGDCFRPLGNGALLLFNPPYLPENKEEDARLKKTELVAFVGGAEGWETGFRFVNDATQRLMVPSIVIFSTIAISKKSCLEKLSRLGNARIVGNKKLEFEEIFAVLVDPLRFFERLV